MARVGISITKTTLFRGAQQEFSNVYYYDGGLVHPDTAGANNMIDEVANREKTFHSTLVNFVRGRCWKQIGSPSQNEMISTKNLSGTGARATQPSLDKERAFLFRLRAGNDSRGNPVYLRKWFHACGLFYTSQPLSGSQVDNTAGFSQSERDAQVAQMNSIGGVSSGGGPWVLCAKNGRLPDAGATWSAHQFLEHRQLGDMWRAV